MVSAPASLGRPDGGPAAGEPGLTEELASVSAADEATLDESTLDEAVLANETLVSGAPPARPHASGDLGRDEKRRGSQARRTEDTVEKGNRS